MLPHKVSRYRYFLKKYLDTDTRYFIKKYLDTDTRYFLKKYLDTDTIFEMYLDTDTRYSNVSVDTFIDTS